MGWSNTTSACSTNYYVNYDNGLGSIQWNNVGSGGSGGICGTIYTNTYEELLDKICYLEHRVESLEKFVEDLKDFATSKDIEEYLGTILDKPHESRE